ncbi:MAG: hypothetical protein IT378_05355 [Sandaracinaceae bacterium]|nr:hypothetical protein [Sandaracinaceae bacterium]
MNWLAVFLVAAAAAGCSGESTREGTANVVGGLVERGKGIATGIQEGASQGREGVQGEGGAVTLTQAAQIHEQVTIEVLESRAANGGVELVIGFGTQQAHPIHVAGLQTEGNAVLLDRDGFATNLRSGTNTIEIPASARVRVTLQFAGDASRAARVRLWGREFDIPAAPAAGN